MTEYLRADPQRRTDIRFPSAGEELAGHLYRPPGAKQDERMPAVALCGPISSVKEQTLPHYAERLADGGYTALTFDPRGFGESTGEPRARYDPWAVIEDFHSAVSHLLARTDVDPARVGIVGVCMGGGYAVSLAARDKRIGAAVAIAGGYDIGTTFQQGFGVAGFATYVRRINDLVQQQYEDGEVRYVPTIAHALDDDTPIAVMPNDEAYEYYDRTAGEDAPHWPRELTADSLPVYFAYNAVAAAPLVAPTPLMIIHGTQDAALLPEFAQATYAAAADPKEMVWLETDNHVQLYDQEPYVPDAARHAIRWLDAQLTA